VQNIRRWRQIDHLGDIGGMVADALEVLGDEQQVRARRDMSPVLHHVGDAACGRCCCRSSSTTASRCTTASASSASRAAKAFSASPTISLATCAIEGRREIGSIVRVLIADLGHALGDVLGIVADALDHADDLQRRDHLAQVVRHRRAQRDDLDHQRSTSASSASMRSSMATIHSPSRPAGRAHSIDARIALSTRPPISAISRAAC
jgi:hypothetical protein